MQRFLCKADILIEITSKLTLPTPIILNLIINNTEPQQGGENYNSSGKATKANKSYMSSHYWQHDNDWSFVKITLFACLHYHTMSSWLLPDAYTYRLSFITIKLSVYKVILYYTEISAVQPKPSAPPYSNLYWIVAR